MHISVQDVSPCDTGFGRNVAREGRGQSCGMKMLIRLSRGESIFVYQKYLNLAECHLNDRPRGSNKPPCCQERGPRFISRSQKMCLTNLHSFVAYTHTKCRPQQRKTEAGWRTFGTGDSVRRKYCALPRGCQGD